MARNMEFNLEIDHSIDEVFDEGVGSSFLALRRIRWNENREVLDSIKDRDDFLYNVKDVLDEMGENSDLIAVKPASEDSETSFFDPKELMANADE